MSAALELETAPCLCGNAGDGATIRAIDPVEGEPWTYCRCSACSLERLSPRPAIAAMGRFYPDDYSPYADPTPQPVSRIDRLKRLVYETYFADPGERSETAKRYRPLLQLALWPLRQHSVLSFRPPASGRHVFELGAGTGADLVEFRNAGWEVSGCEPSAVAAKAAADNGITLQVCNAEDADIPDGVSCVYMNNVFEHLHDPMAVLAKARAKLAAGGIVVVIVPNHASWAARLFGPEWPGYDPPRHIWGYTPRAIRGIFERAGFGNISINQKYPLSTHCWGSGLQRPRAKDAKLGPAAVRALGRGLVLGGMAAAAAGSGDYMRVVGEKLS